MKKLEIIIKPERLDDLKAILDANKATGLMITNIMGYGNQKGVKRLYRGNEYFSNLLAKTKVETVVKDEMVGPIVSTITKELSTGNIGDGKIFVYDVADAIRIRTGESGEAAI